jgi:beta-xylosidase
VVGLSGCGGGTRATFTNPVYGGDFPDPFVLKAGDACYAYATNGTGKQVQTLTSKDLVHWQPGPDALPKVGSWTFNGETWAQEVLKRSDDSYVLYNTATKCIGRVYHAWDAAYSKRQLWIDRLDWKDGKPVVDGPTCTAQDAPKP